MKLVQHNPDASYRVHKRTRQRVRAHLEYLARFKGYTNEEVEHLYKVLCEPDVKRVQRTDFFEEFLNSVCD